ncbi:MAG: PilZ domain-containing protein [bacterium]|nr:PilZ domain-containing protein [bacterium]
MAGQPERRKHRRLSIRLPIECVASLGDRRTTVRTVTCDISSGGVCFEVDSEEYPVGTSLEMEFGVPPGDGHSPYPGRVRGTGTVVRVGQLEDAASTSRYRVTAQFSRTLKLVF